MAAWTADKEKICKNIGDKSGAFVWLFNRTAQKHEKYNMIYSLIVMIGAYVFGASGIPVIFSGSGPVNKYINLAIQIAVIILGIIATVKRFLAYDKKMGADRWMSGKWANLFLKISRELNKEASERQVYEKFYVDITDLENENLQTMPEIPQCVIDDYYQKMGKNALPYNVLFGETISSPTSDEAPRVVVHEGSASSTRETEAIDRLPTTHSNQSQAPGAAPAHETKIHKQKVGPRERYELEKYFLD
jgi:hypothetical protein